MVDLFLDQDRRHHPQTYYQTILTVNSTSAWVILEELHTYEVALFMILDSVSHSETEPFLQQAKRVFEISIVRYLTRRIC